MAFELGLERTEIHGEERGASRAKCTVGAEERRLWDSEWLQQMMGKSGGGEGGGQGRRLVSRASDVASSVKWTTDTLQDASASQLVSSAGVGAGGASQPWASVALVDTRCSGVGPLSRDPRIS